MKLARRPAVILIGLLLLACAYVQEAPHPEAGKTSKLSKETHELHATLRKIEPFFKPMGKPEAYDWLGSHSEPGQTFEEYLDSDPTKPTKERQKIYILPLGTFTPRQKAIIETAAGYLAVFYDLQVATMPNRAFPQRLDKKDSRFNQYLQKRQVRTGYIMDVILKPMLPKDAAALIAFTAEDLFPDDTMSFVFGQASLENRVGVWSLARLEANANRETFLRRTLKIAVHETGHMFSMRHCTKYECVMSGTNHIGETDRRPIDACPECTAKVCWISDISAAVRYKKLAEFCRKSGLENEANEFERKAKAVS